MSRGWPRLILLILFLALAGRGEAKAHGMGWRVTADQAVVLVFRYASGEPMAFGEVLVYAPGEAEHEYQNGRTDENGGFAFRPDRSGAWRVVGSDGQGHIARGVVDVSDSQIGPTATATVRTLAAGGAQPPGWGQIVLGVSLLVNLALASWWWQSRRKNDARV